MKKICLSFATHCHISDLENYSFEKIYDENLTKIARFLFNHPKVSFSFYLPSPYIEWISDNHSEFLLVLKDLTNRKQLEILGGGYYEPIFPLILPLDRIGQIEESSTIVRKKIGKRIRGIFLGDSIWDPSLISSFKNCGMDYVIVNNQLIPENAEKGKVFIVEDIGKTLCVIPSHDFQNTMLEPQVFLEKITKSLFNDSNNDSSYNERSLYFSSIPLWKLGELIDSNWIETFFQLATDSPLFEFVTPSNYINGNVDFERTFIPGGCPEEIKKWAIVPFTASSEENKIKNANIRNFVYTYQEVQYLYSRMMYTTTVATQCKGDKVRKKTAKEYLWKAQRQDLYWFLGDAGICNPKNRKEAYKNLILSEKSVRETSPSIANSFLSFDYDMDGRKEYVIHKNDYSAFISACGGMIFELDLISNAKNYCDTMHRIPFFDGIMDFYPKKLFVDHLIDFDHFENFKKDISTCSAVFSQVVYSETLFDRVRKELVLTANALFGILQQPVQLRKKFAFADNGIKVQYILKNESPLPLKCFFAVESNLSFSSDSEDDLLIEVIADENKEKIVSNYLRDDGVSVIQFTDIEEKNVFVFEANEQSGTSIQSLYITRPINGKSEKLYQATSSCFFWKIDIPPSYELEKTIFLSIVSSKKSKKKKV